VAQVERGTGREWYEGIVHAVTTAVADAKNRSARTRELKNKSHPELMTRAHVNRLSFIRRKRT